jgi:hypothetical protein
MKLRIGLMIAMVATITTATPKLAAGAAIPRRAPGSAMLRKPSEDTPYGTARAWVHPTDGLDPATTNAGLAYINDPSLKFKTLQSAIDTMESFLMLEYDSVDNPNQQGIVYALPGLYGPHGPTSSTDSFPILMRDRVHVQGLGARRCVIRGASTTPNSAPGTSAPGPYQIPFPTAPTAPTTIPTLEVLVSFRYSTPTEVFPNTRAPWDLNVTNFSQDHDVPEVFDAFTLEGGELQLLLMSKPPATTGAVYFSAARISNCVFDLRHEWMNVGNTKLAGPYFGIMMLRSTTYDTGNPQPSGYLDGRVLIANNTFIFARFGNAEVPTLWESQSRPETVGIIDLTNPCGSIPDADNTFRGVGNPCIVSNLFRTHPAPNGSSIRPFAMLGVEAVDTELVGVPGSSAPVQTNAFDPARVGSSNGYFWSVPVSSTKVLTSGTGIVQWDCHATPVVLGNTCGILPPPPCAASAVPQPIMPIWDGNNGADPGFVGEYIATSTAMTDYRDWRLLPGSAMEDLGYLPPASTHVFRTAPHWAIPTPDATWDFDVSFPPELSMYQWDGEHWGNPRSINGAPDIGFDERGLFICAGDWGNDSNCHNQPWFMQPSAGIGGTTRFFILPDNAGGVDLTSAGFLLKVCQSILTPPSPLSTGNAWVNPPNSLANPVTAPVGTGTGQLPLYYGTKYIALTQVITSWPDQPLVNAVGTYLPLHSSSQFQLTFRLVTQVDDECNPLPCTESYFNMQAVVVEPAPSNAVKLRGNMQGEYR